MATMLDQKGPEFVTNWPDSIARMTGVGVGIVSEAIETVLGITITEGEIYQGMRSGTPHPAIAALTVPTAIAIHREMKKIKAALLDGGCHYCGLPLTHGRCTECV